MIRRVFWFTVGAGVAVFVVVKVRGVLQQATPQALGQRVTASAGELGGSVRDFSDRVRAAMAERETELRDALGLND
jgi:NADH:ubiquinone oxidoreductase subunit D